MSDIKILDIAHISFLELIKSAIAQTGPAAAKGMLVRNAISAGEKMERADFKDLEAFAASIEAVANPITKAEGKAVHLGDGLFGLPSCPFGPSIRNYKAVHGEMPPDFDLLTEEVNKQGGISEKYRVGAGAGVSPFCAVHQPLRSVLGGNITIGGKPISIYQLGCKSGTGEKGLAKKWIEETGYDTDRISKVLDDHMCCYVVVVEG
jgi:hypothetical protein